MKQVQQPMFEILSPQNFGQNVQVSPEWGYWFAGFVDGEACFHASLQTKYDKVRIIQSFKISLRADDLDILKEMQDTLMIGNMHYRKGCDVYHEQYAWTVSHRREIYNVLVPVLERFPLRSKKRLEFVPFRELAYLLYHKHHLKGYWDEAVALVETLQKLKQYEGG